MMQLEFEKMPDPAPEEVARRAQSSGESCSCGTIMTKGEAEASGVCLDCLDAAFAKDD